MVLAGYTELMMMMMIVIYDVCGCNVIFVGVARFAILRWPQDEKYY